jgi:hypothetical protein
MFVKQSDSKSVSVWRKWVPQCANPNCLTKSLLQSINHRNQGMNIDGSRYCTPDCFENAVKRMINELMISQGRPAKARSSRVPLGLLLLQRGVLTAEQLKIALAQHKVSTQLNFGDVLQQLGFATKEQVTAAVAAQWACPVFALGDRRLANELHIPRQFLELYRMIPVHYSDIDRRLLIGFVSGVQHQVLYTIGQVTSCTVVPCFITGREYDSHLNSPSTPFLRDHETVFDQVLDSSAMAQIITEYVVKFAAERFRMGHCRDYFWARISGNEGEADLLFRMNRD